MRQRTQLIAGLVVIVGALVLHLSVFDAPPVPDGADETGSQLFYQQHPDGGQYRGPFYIDDRAHYLFREDGGERVITEMGYVYGPRADAVQGLARFYTVTRLDPLFWSPLSGEMDFEGAGSYDDRLFNRGIDADKRERLEQVRAEVLEGRDLLPVQYIQNLSRVDDATERFLDRSSRESARSLLGVYADTSIAYSDAAGSLTETMVRSMPQDEDGIEEVRYHLESGKVIGTGSMASYLDRIRQNADRLQEEVRRRYRLMQGDEESTPPQYRTMPDGGTLVDRERLLSDARVREMLGERLHATIDAGDRRSLAGSVVEGPYRVQLPCMDQQRQVVRLEQDDLGHRLQYFVVDGVARNVAYPGGGPTGYTTQPRIIPADVPVNVTVQGNTSRYAVGSFAPFERDLVRGGEGIGRGETFYWANESPENLGVLTETEHQFAYWQCPFGASSRWDWHAIELMQGMVADRRLGNDSLRDAPAPVRDAFSEVSAAEREFLAESSQRSMSRLGTAYGRAVSALRGASGDEVGRDTSWHARGPGLVERAVFISSRVSVMDEVFSEHSAHDHTFQTFRDQLGFSGHIEHISTTEEARDVLGPRAVLTYSFMDLFLAPRSASVWRLDGWADPTVEERARPTTAIYPFAD